MFENWCALQSVQSFPAAPTDIARFVVDCAPLGIEAIWPTIGDISQAHRNSGLADPTQGGVVAGAINELADIDPPRSWPKEEKLRFFALPYDLQVYVAASEARRDKEVKRAQSEAGALKQKLAALQQPAKVNNASQNAAA